MQHLQGIDRLLLLPLTGGSRGSNTNTWSTTETWKYITREGRWVTVAPMLRPRTNHTSATLNGEIYVIGGKMINVIPEMIVFDIRRKSNNDGQRMK